MQGAIVEALRTGKSRRGGRASRGPDPPRLSALRPRIREGLLLAGRQLTQGGLIAIEDGEYFLTPDGRIAELRVKAALTPSQVRLLQATLPIQQSTALQPPIPRLPKVLSPGFRPSPSPTAPKCRQTVPMTPGSHRPSGRIGLGAGTGFISVRTSTDGSLRCATVMHRPGDSDQDLALPRGAGLLRCPPSGIKPLGRLLWITSHIHTSIGEVASRPSWTSERCLRIGDSGAQRFTYACRAILSSSTSSLQLLTSFSAKNLLSACPRLGCAGSRRLDHSRP